MSYIKLFLKTVFASSAEHPEAVTQYIYNGNFRPKYQTKCRRNRKYFLKLFTPIII